MDQIETSFPISGFLNTRQGGRPENQDSYLSSDTSYGLLVIVCDGMGGGPAGKVASLTAVQQIHAYITNPQNAKQERKEILKNAIEYAHQCIINLGDQNHALRGMGTTVAAILINDYSAILAHVGDSRIYQFRYGRKIYRTSDHSYVGELVKKGDMTEEQARLSSQSNIITRALGGTEHQPDIYERPYEVNDRFMLCTDGIWGAMPEKDLIKRIVKTPSLSGTVDGICLEVDEIGRDNGNHHDNLTIALLETKQNSQKKEKMSKKTRQILMGLVSLCILSLFANFIMAIKLMTPSEESAIVKDLETKINRQEQIIESLRNTEYKLRNDVVNSKQEAADAKMDAAKEKAKAAEKARLEAEQKKKETNESNEQVSKTVTNRTKTIDGVISVLTQARDKPEGKERQNLRDRAMSTLKILVSKDPNHKVTYNDVIDKLKNPVAKQNSNMSKGHYNMLIQSLKKIK